MYEVIKIHNKHGKRGPKDYVLAITEHLWVARKMLEVKEFGSIYIQYKGEKK